VLPQIPEGEMDRSILERFIEGDHEAFALVMARYQGMIYRWGLLVFGFDHEAAGDLVQTTFTRAFEYCDRFKPDRAPLRFWLLGIARNVGRDMKRGVFRREKREMQYATRIISDNIRGWNEPEPGDLSLVSLMKTLPSGQREVLVCRFLAEMSVKETAQALGIAEGTVKSRTERGLNALQERWPGDER